MLTPIPRSVLGASIFPQSTTTSPWERKLFDIATANIHPFGAREIVSGIANSIRPLRVITRGEVHRELTT